MEFQNKNNNNNNNNNDNNNNNNNNNNIGSNYILGDSQDKHDQLAIAEDGRETLDSLDCGLDLLMPNNRLQMTYNLPQSNELESNLGKQTALFTPYTDDTWISSCGDEYNE